METIIAITLGIIFFIIEILAIRYVNKINSKPEEDFKDWDITLMDGLEEEEQDQLKNQ